MYKIKDGGKEKEEKSERESERERERERGDCPYEQINLVLG